MSKNFLILLVFIMLGIIQLVSAFRMKLPKIFESKMKLIKDIKSVLKDGRDYVVIKGMLYGEEREFRLYSLELHKTTPNVLHQKYDVYVFGYSEGGEIKYATASDFHIRRNWKIVEGLEN